MNSRQIQKNTTRDKILYNAKKIFIKNGFLNTTTEKIAKAAGIAHGTLFLHFKNKEILILKIFDMELNILTDELHLILINLVNLDDILLKYLDFLEKEEKFFSIIAKEFPFYSDKLKRQIIFRESAIKNYFYIAIDKGIEKNIYKKVNITCTLTFLFGTINYYLINKDLFTSDNGIIKEKKELILNTFLTFLSKEIL
jgi:AcrR family transcriptional regulator